MRGINMGTFKRSTGLIWTRAALPGIALTVGLALSPTAVFPDSREGPSRGIGKSWTTLRVDLPVSQTGFPAGDGVEIATSQCLICHSAGMVLRQPPLTRDEWVAEITKMRNAFGALLPADQVDALASYLYKINGRRTSKDPTSVDGQGS
jgi:hypothetical protein